MEKARGEREGQAGARRQAEDHEHEHAHQPHDGLNEEKREEPVKLELDQNVPARMHEGRRDDGGEDVTVHRVIPARLSLGQFQSAGKPPLR